MPSAPLQIVCIEGSCTSVATVTASPERVSVSRALIHRAADDPPPPLAEHLRGLGLARGKTILAVPRSAAVLKVLPIPRGLRDEGERLSMVALQLERALPTAGGENAIDSIAVATGEGEIAIAAATDRGVLEAARTAADELGAKVIGAELRCTGAAALGNHAGGHHTLVIAPGVVTTEIVLARGGVPLFARSISSTADGPETDRDAARIAVEAKRTLMGARAAGLGEEPEAVVVLTQGESAGAIADACELELGLAARDPSVTIEWHEDIDADCRAHLAPLAGIAAHRAAGLDAIDFMTPHQPPDTGARRRQLVLLTLFVLVTLIGFGFIARDRHLDGLREREEAAQVRRNEVALASIDHLTDDARVTHAELWARADRDWLAQTDFVASSIAATQGTKLRELRASSDTAFSFTSPESTPEDPKPKYPGTWTRQAETTLRVEGAAGSAPSTRALRRRFLDAEEFHVLTQGPDSGALFTFDLVSLNRDVVGGPE